MVRNTYKSVLLVLLFTVSGYSDLVGNQPEALEVTDNTNVETVQTKSQRKCSCNVTIEQDDDRRDFLLTFHFEPYKSNIAPVFYMNERISGGIGLKVQKIIPYDAAEITVCKPDPEDERGRLIKISSSSYPDLSGDYYDFFDGRDGRKVVFEQRVWLQGRFPSEEGLYAVTYEHPWENLEGTNVKFFSNTLLVSVSSSTRWEEINSLFKDNPELKLARYQMKYPTNSEFAKYRRPLGFFDKYIQIGMPYDEVLFLMGSPDSSWLYKENLHWSYETSPVGGFNIVFENGKVAAKVFSFDSP